jgi:hypothetical protein
MNGVAVMKPGNALDEFVVLSLESLVAARRRPSAGRELRQQTSYRWTG